MWISNLAEVVAEDLHLWFTSTGKRSGILHDPNADVQSDEYQIIFSELPKRINIASLLTSVSEKCTILKLKVCLGVKDRYNSTVLLECSRQRQIQNVIRSFHDTSFLSRHFITCREITDCKRIQVGLFLQNRSKKVVDEHLKPYLVGKSVSTITDRGKTYGHVEIRFSTFQDSNCSYENLMQPNLKIFRRHIIVKFLVKSPQYK